MKSRRGKLLANLNGGTNIPIIGFVCWWNIRNVDLTQERYLQILSECGLSEKYAREHNYRSAFLRALKNMEEKRIIRMVKEDSKVMIYQFTAEDRVGEGEDARLDYNPETVIVIDKELYRKTKSIEAAMTKGEDAIKRKVIEYWNDERTRFKSSDVSRALHKILGREADIVSLREQGSVYYVPGGYRSVIDKARLYTSLLGGDCGFDAIPIPDAPESRETVRGAVMDEVDGFTKWLEAQIKELEGGKEVTSRWFNTKRKKIAEARDRLELYADLLGEGKSGVEAQFAALEAELFKPRELDI
jgi:hypothetical protein